MDKKNENEIKYDKEWNGLCFLESEHKYFHKKYPYLKYTSITTLIGQYCQPFDKDFWASYGAVKNILGEVVFKKSGTKAMFLDIKEFKYKWLDMLGISKNDFEAEKLNILAEWDRKNKEACEYGTQYHLEKELSFYTKPKYKIPEISDEIEFVSEKYNYDFNRENAIMCEALVSYHSPDGIVALSGSVDLIYKYGNKVKIKDFKTNTKPILGEKAFFDTKTKKTVRMKYPLQHLDDTVYNHYSLQLSMYAYMIQIANPEIEIVDLELLHKPKGGEETKIKVPYLKKECKNIIIDQWKKNKILKEKEILKQL